MWPKSLQHRSHLESMLVCCHRAYDSGMLRHTNHEGIKKGEYHRHGEDIVELVEG